MAELPAMTTSSNKKRQKLTLNQRAFLAAYRDDPVRARACRATGISRGQFYAWEKSNATFREEFQHAYEEMGDELEAVARHRAIEGVRKLKFFKGDPITVPVFDDNGEPVTDDNGEPVMEFYTEHEYSDRLLSDLLKAHKPELFGEKVKHEGKVDHEHSGSVRVYLPDNRRDILPVNVESNGRH